MKFQTSARTAHVSKVAQENESIQTRINRNGAVEYMLSEISKRRRFLTWLEKLVFSVVRFTDYCRAW